MCAFTPIGPGRYKARTAEISSNESGFIERNKDLIGPLSSWNTPRVSPRANNSYVFGSSRPSSSRTTVSPRFDMMLSKVSSSTVRFRSPKKSIFSRPSDSHAPISNWVIIAPSWSLRQTGKTLINSSLHKITPAACTPGWRFRPSMPRAVSTTARTSASSSYKSRNSPASP